jgi:hypothetical protein
MAKSKSTGDDLRERTLGALVTDAFFQWPSALTIALTFIAFFSGIRLFEAWQPWFWLVAGAALEIIFIVATITDPKAREEAVNRIVAERYDPADVKNLAARTHLKRALEYKRSIDEYVSRQEGAMQVALKNTADSIDEWIALIYRLAKDIDTFEANPITERDRRQVPNELSALQRRLTIESDPSVRAEIQKAIDIKKALYDDLQQVANSVKRTEIKMDTTVAQLSTVHARMQLLSSRELDNGRAQRLEREIHDEVASLKDIVGAMEDAYGNRDYNEAMQALAESEQVSNVLSEDTPSDLSQKTNRKSASS